MGQRLNSWGDLGGSGGNRAKFRQESWKKEGLLKCVLHREPPWVRHLHNIRRVEKVEQRGELKRILLWYPFVCSESEDYHRQRRFDGRDAPGAQMCSSCRLIEHIETRDDIAGDEVIFKFVAGRETRSIIKDDFLGISEHRDAYKDDFTAKQEYLIPIIEIDDPEAGVVITGEKWSLARSLQKRIKDDCKIYGVDNGDPMKKAIGYVFSYDKDAVGAAAYSVSRIDGFKASPTIQELWAGDCPSADSYVKPGNPHTLLEQLQEACQVDGIPFAEIFAPAIAAYDGEEEEEGDPSYVPPREEKERVPPVKSKGGIDFRKHMRKVKPKEEPKPEQEVPSQDAPACPECGAAWPMALHICPGCGAEAEDDEEGAAPQEPAKATKPVDTSRRQRYEPKQQSSRREVGPRDEVPPLSDDDIPF